MSSNIDDWINEGVEEAVAQVAGPPPAPAPQPVAPRTPAYSPSLLTPTKPTRPITPVATSPTQVAQSPSRGSAPNRVRNRGGVITNPATKIITQTSNPITNPRRPTGQLRGKTVEALPADQEEVQEFMARNPGVVVPSLLMGMDVNATKPPAPVAAPVLQAPQQPAQQPSPGQPVSFDSTLRQLLELALQNGGSWNIAHSKFVVTVKILTPTTA